MPPIVACEGSNDCAILAHYRTVIDSIRPVIFRMDARGAFTFLSAAWTEVTGFAVADSLGHGFLTFVHPDDRERLAQAFQPVADNRAEYIAVEARYLTCAGGHRWVEVLGQLELEADGMVGGLFGTLTDITERRTAEAELQAVRGRLEHLLVSSPAVVLASEVVEPYAITFVSENVHRQLGYRADDAVGDPGFWIDRVHPDDASRVRAALAALGGTTPAEASRRLEYRFRSAGDEYRWIQDTRRVVRDAEGCPVELVGSWVDVTDHRATEDERAMLSSVVEQSAEAMIITSRDAVVQWVNPACERLTGYAAAEIVGHPVAMLHSEPSHGVFGPIWEQLTAGEPWSGRLVNLRKDGSRYEAEVMICPVRDASGGIASFVASMHDVTPQREMEDQLRQAQKMEIAGRLAGGVAHDFNNHLTVIMGRSELLLRRVQGDEAVERDVRLVQETARRASELTRQLLLFSRKKSAVRRPTDLAGVVTGVEGMLRRLIPEDLELVTAADPHVGRVLADGAQIEQVIMNLVVNARDAMPNGGRLVIETRNVDADDRRLRRIRDARPGAHVLLAVSDSGCGMDAETKAHIFEPFFTTKGPDCGTGLGLSIVYGVVQQHDGHILVESEPGRGTTFRIFLPRVETPSDREVVAPAPRTAVRGTETVLLVEDEVQVRELAREILRMHGYAVIEARHGWDALELARRYEHPIHLVLTDVIMPHMSGPELVERLSTLRPDTRVLYMSGYTEDDRIDHHALAQRAALIEKPFTPDRLAGKIRQVLDAPAGMFTPGHDTVAASV